MTLTDAVKNTPKRFQTVRTPAHHWTVAVRTRRMTHVGVRAEAAAATSATVTATVVVRPCGCDRHTGEEPGQDRKVPHGQGFRPVAMNPE